MKKLLLSLMLITALCFGGSGVVFAEPIEGPDLPGASGPTEDAKKKVCEGISGQVGGTCDGSGVGINKVMQVVLQIISFVAGVAAIIMVIVAGFKYILSGGDSNSISSAKSTLIYAIIGIVIVAVAQVLVHYVFSQAVSS